MLSSCFPTHSLLTSPKPHSPLCSGGTWRFRGQEEQPRCEPGAVVSEGCGAGPSQGCWEPRSWAGSNAFAELAGRWVVGISLLTCVPGWWTMCPRATLTLWPLERHSFLSCVSLGATEQATRKSGAGDGGSSATPIRTVAYQWVLWGAV